MNNSNVCEPTGQYLPDQVFLLGDSIFDNAPYVGPNESVSEQLQALFGESANVQLSAVDGHVIANIPSQLEQAESIECAKHHAFLSCGGNDLLGYNVTGLLSIEANSIGYGLNSLHQVRENFRSNYQEMLDMVQKKYPTLTICTVYDSIPNLTNAERIALGLFNEVILREAAQRQLDVLDLRIICSKPEDFAPVSPIEPSKFGAEKIANAIYQKCNQDKNEFKGSVV